jgi:tol-pal system protein YbgF
MRSLRFVSPLLLGFSLLATSPGAALAQSSDIRPVLDRMERMERDLSILQRQVYRGQTPPPASGGGAASASSAAEMDSSIAINLQSRLTQMENELRALTGKIEETSFAETQLANRLERLQKDYELRFSEIEKAQQAASQAQPQTAAQPQQSLSLPAAQPGLASGMPGDEKIVLRPPASAQPGVLGTLPASEPESKIPAAAKAPPPAAPAGKKLSPQEQYDQAFALLRQGDYDQAEKSFTAFVAQHPGDNLTGNAQYWLGETFYVRGDHQKAAAAFAEGYQKYPKSQKAPDNLLKLGLALAGLGQKKEACITFSRLAKDFPQSADALKRRATAERQRLGCE